MRFRVREQIEAVTAVTAERRTDTVGRAHRFRQVGRVLLGDTHAARPGMGTHGRGVAAPRSHARSGRSRRAAQPGSPSRSIRRTSIPGPRPRARIAADEIDLLLIAPERLANPGFRRASIRDDAEPRVRARLRRGSLHLGLGSRLPSRLSPAASSALRAARLDAGVGDDGDRERAGHR